MWRGTTSARGIWRRGERSWPCVFRFEHHVVLRYTGHVGVVNPNFFAIGEKGVIVKDKNTCSTTSIRQVAAM